MNTLHRVGPPPHPASLGLPAVTAGVTAGDLGPQSFVCR